MVVIHATTLQKIVSWFGVIKVLHRRAMRKFSIGACTHAGKSGAPFWIDRKSNRSAKIFSEGAGAAHQKGLRSWRIAGEYKGCAATSTYAKCCLAKQVCRLSWEVPAWP